MVLPIFGPLTLLRQNDGSKRTHPSDKTDTQPSLAYYDFNALECSSSCWKEFASGVKEDTSKGMPCGGKHGILMAMGGRQGCHWAGSYRGNWNGPIMRKPMDAKARQGMKSNAIG